MKKEFRLTRDGINALEQELVDLKKRQPEVADNIRTAREFGDLTENAEYQAAKDEASRVENRINEIEHILGNVEIISSTNHDKVELGNTVTLADDDKVVEYTIVGSVEANPLEQKISDESPIGRALLGRRVGEEVLITLPSGETKYKVKKIN